jgi:hypothetical protein
MNSADDDANYMTFERADVWVERHGRFHWSVMRGRGEFSSVAEYVGKRHWFRWAANRHARRLPPSYFPQRTGLTRAEALTAIGVPTQADTGGETT